MRGAGIEPATCVNCFRVDLRPSLQEFTSVLRNIVLTAEENEQDNYKGCDFLSGGLL